MLPKRCPHKHFAYIHSSSPHSSYMPNPSWPPLDLTILLIPRDFWPINLEVPCLYSLYYSLNAPNILNTTKTAPTDFILWYSVKYFCTTFCKKRIIGRPDHSWWSSFFQLLVINEDEWQQRWVQRWMARWNQIQTVGDAWPSHTETMATSCGYSKNETTQTASDKILHPQFEVST